MSSVDLKNPKVMRNYLMSQASEGNGTFELKQNVVIFKNKEGQEMIVPDEMQEEKLLELGVVTKKEEKKEVVDEEMNLLKEEAKTKGIAGFGNMKKETLIQRLSELEAEEKDEQSKEVPSE